ncbi:uncharacterized protein [Pyxicephalus adspersus]|uniref:uncharacterized protein n=1 Tax=Pyxicephalus adspersus TaxID=30357 RepID=UPI003B5B0664
MNRWKGGWKAVWFILLTPALVTVLGAPLVMTSRKAHRSSTAPLSPRGPGAAGSDDQAYDSSEMFQTPNEINVEMNEKVNFSCKLHSQHPIQSITVSKGNTLLVKRVNGSLLLNNDNIDIDGTDQDFMVNIKSIGNDGDTDIYYCSAQVNIKGKIHDISGNGTFVYEGKQDFGISNMILIPTVMFMVLAVLAFCKYVGWAKLMKLGRAGTPSASTTRMHRRETSAV